MATSTQPDTHGATRDLGWLSGALFSLAGAAALVPIVQLIFYWRQGEALFWPVLLWGAATAVFLAAMAAWLGKRADFEKLTVLGGGLALITAVLPAVILIQYATQEKAGFAFLLFVWAAALALALLLVVVAFRFTARTPGPSEQIDRQRLFLMVLGGVSGLFLTLLGFVLPFTTYYEQFGGGIKGLRENPLGLLAVAGCVIGGLGLMFLSLQLGRGGERSSQAIRRIVYGFNAVVTGLLLAGILGLLNLLAVSVPLGRFDFFKTTFDYTKNTIYSLQPASRDLLASLDKPLTVYVLGIPVDSPQGREVQTLLDNARAVNPQQFSTDWVSRDRRRAEMQDLLKKFPVREPLGLLVVYGIEPKQDYDFIKADDLFDERGGSPDDPTFAFKGESLLMKSVSYLAEGKAKPVVYFVQGNDELSVDDRDPRKLDEGLGVLWGQLEKGNYELRKLDFGAGDLTRVPEDADVVVIARPRKELPASAIKALRDYLRGVHGKKGKLLALMDVVTRSDGTLIQTGLEPLLAEFNVRLGNGRILNPGGLLGPGVSIYPTDQLIMPNRQSNNPIAQAFQRGNTLTRFFFEDCRVAAPAGAPGGDFQAEEILQTALRDVWEETNLKGNPAQLAADLRKNPEALKAKLSKTPLSVGVAVTEGRSEFPQDRAHAGLTSKSQEPRMVVVGDASWVTNQSIRSQFGDDNYDLFVSCLTWLRERPGVGPQVPDKARDFYRLTVEPETSVRLLWLPGVLLVLAIMSLGLGVWVVRRR